MRFHRPQYPVRRVFNVQRPVFYTIIFSRLAGWSHMRGIAIVDRHRCLWKAPLMVTVFETNVPRRILSPILKIMSLCIVVIVFTSSILVSAY